MGKLSYFEQAADALRQAFGATGLGEQALLLDEAQRLHALAIADERTRRITGLRVLIVEDEYMIADGLRDELERVGAVVLGPLASVEEALALLEEDVQVDGAVLDISLRGKPSYVVADELLRRNVPVVLATGYDQNALPERYQHLPVCLKPTPPGLVSETITRLISA